MPLSLSSYRSLHNGSINAEPSCWGQGMCAVLSRSVVSDSLWPHGLQPTRLLCPWISQARILEWVAMPASRGSSQPRVITNPGLPYRRRILYCLSHQGTPKILEWVAYPFSRDLPNPGIKPGSPALQADSLPAELPEFIWKVNRARRWWTSAPKNHLLQVRIHTLLYEQGGC